MGDGFCEWFLLRLRGHSKEQRDNVVWKGDGKDSFSVRALYALMQLDCATLFPVEIIWNSWVSSRVRFLCLGSFLAKGVGFLDRLQRRGWSLVSMFTLCKEEV